MSGSAKGMSRVLTLFVLALVPLMALSSWAWLISPGGPWEPVLPSWMDATPLGLRDGGAVVHEVTQGSANPGLNYGTPLALKSGQRARRGMRRDLG